MSAEEVERMKRDNPAVREVYEAAERVPPKTSARPRVSVHLGATVPAGEYTSDRFDFTVDGFEVPEGKDVKVALDELERVLDAKCAERRAKILAQSAEKQTASTGATTAAKATESTRSITATPAIGATAATKAVTPLDLETIDKLPWKMYESGKPDRGEWIRSDVPGAEGLVAYLKARKGFAEIGTAFVLRVYRLQAGGRFVGRYPVKGERH